MIFKLFEDYFRTKTKFFQIISPVLKLTESFKNYAIESFNLIGMQNFANDLSFIFIFVNDYLKIEIP